MQVPYRRQTTLQKDKDCKGSVRFSAPPATGGKKPLIQSVYVSRPEADGKTVCIIDVTLQ